MKSICFDTETCLFRPGVMAPEIVCLTWEEYDDVTDTRTGPFIVRFPDARGLLAGWLADDSILLVGHNVAFDVLVTCAEWPDLLPLWLNKYDADQVTDTMYRQKLLDIASGCYRGKPGENGKWISFRYSLDDCIYRVRGARLDKDTWRTRYGELRSTLLEEWPEGARQYPIEDARATMDVFLNQQVHAAPYLADQFRQARAYLALQFSSVWGLRTDPAGVEEFEHQVLAELADVKADLMAAGLVRADGSRNMKAAQQAMIEACLAEGLELRTTDGGAPSLDKDACDALQSPIIKLYSQYQTLSKNLSNDCPMLKAGTIFPIHPHYDLADTGRTTCTGPNIQALRRKKGIREAFGPRAGYVYGQADFEGLELHTLAQTCKELVGYSTLGDALNRGEDVHSSLAAEILQCPYEEVLEGIKDKTSKYYDARQAGKVGNFGLPVGLGVDTLVYYARKTYGVRLNINPQTGEDLGLQYAKERAWKLKQAWMARWPEMQEYFAYINRLCANPENLATVHQLYVGRIHGGVRYTGACSGFSQGLGGDAAKRALWLVTRAQFDPTSPLFGSHVVAFIHDEIISEIPDNERAHDAVVEMARLMCKGANELIPDYPVEAPPLLMRVWSKEAKAIYNEQKRLVPWEPKKAA